MNQKILSYIIFFSFLFDAANAILVRVDPAYTRISIFYRALVELYLLIYFADKKEFKRVYGLIAILITVFLAGQLSLALTIENSNFLESFIIFNKYLYFIILSIGFLQLERKDEHLNSINKVVNIIFAINNTAILLGFLLSIRIFASYYNFDSLTQGNTRFGYKGFIPAQNEASGVYFFGLAYYLREYFFNNRKKIIIMLIYTAIAALLLGTKASLLFTIILLFYYLFKYRTKLFTWILIPACIVAIVVYGATIKNFILYDVYGYVTYFFESKNYSLITVLLSGRDEKLLDAWYWVSRHWNPLNYIFGGSLVLADSEMDLSDGYFILGAGFLLFMKYYFGIFFHKDNNLDNILVFGLFLLLSILGGHIIYSAIVPAFMLMYVFTFVDAKKAVASNAENLTLGNTTK